MLTQLYEDLHPRLRNFVRRYETYDFDEICGEVWENLVTYVGRIDGEIEGLERIAFTMARRRIIDHRRRRKTRQTFTVDHEHPVFYHLVARDQTDEDAIKKIRDSGIRAELLVTLTPPQVEVLMLRIMHDLSVEEVAKRLGRSQGGVRIIQHRALARLRATSEPWA